MSNLIKADLDRVLRRKSLWLLLIAVLAIITFIILDRVLSAPVKGFAFAEAAGDGISQVGLIIGLFLIHNIYADDFKSMAFINAVGRGISRWKLIVAKFIDTIVIITNMYFVSGLLILALKFIMRIHLSPVEVQYVILKAISDIICTMAGIVFAALFFYLTENMVLGVIAFIFCEVIIPVALNFIVLVPWLSRYHPERIFISGMTSSMMADFMFGNIFGGIGLLLLTNVVYIGLPILITILLFNKKELNF